jgi:Protein of unknown function (DUF1553)/Protein of unknown function (DUF1549)/Planctomycete cytochrome C/Concanavalin A-like lectin/glucanases superfamily
LVAFWSAILSGEGALAADNQPTVDFDRQIRPILSDKCYHCHGPDSAARQADMRLDRGDDVPDYVIVPGKPEESELVQRITSDDDDERMPPPDSHLVLSANEKQLLQQWIREGAVFQEHWSFRPVPQQVAVPAVGESTWPRGDIDRFVLARLEGEKLAPSTPADPLRLLRRVTLDLTGLPPTPQEIRDFEAAVAVDADAAYVEAVDRLLASPAYGEQMAVAWLDAARYADSYGYQSDQLNTQWPFRDWVVRSFNSNLPYNKFITWQLAGDLLANPTPDQILATAFNRLHRLTAEGGSIAEECLVENASDRVQTFGTDVLGLTVECARCHDHKYDPITTRDYYSLSAFFNSIDENGMYDHPDKVPSPTLMLPTKDQSKVLADAKQEVAAAEAAEVDAKSDARRRFDDWLANHPTLDELPDQTVHESFEGDLEVSSAEDQNLKTGENKGAVQRVAGVRGKAVRFDGDFGVFFPDYFDVDRWDAFSLDFYLRDTLRNSAPVVVLQKSHGTDTGYNGFDVMLADGILDVRLFRVWPGNAIGVRALEPIAKDAWQHLTITYDGSSRAKGLRLYLDGKEMPTSILRNRLQKKAVGVGSGSGYFTLGERFRERGFNGGEIDELRVFDRALVPLEVRQLNDGHALNDALANPAAQRQALAEFYASAIDPEVRQRRAELRGARQHLVEAEEPILEVPVMEELAEPRPTYILPRGAYDTPKTDANRVHRDTFEDILAPFPQDAPRNRLGLAQWLTDPNHPLTSRVFINRIWARFFGRGLVATPENFGSQGSAPTHPELLDWLARDFVAHGWDVKRLCRQILLSATYRQDSRLRPELVERDPENLLLARGPSRRLSAEQIRDLALAASGLLNREMGGPPVSPYQPGKDLWRESNTMSPPYRQSIGRELYRRSLYSVWKRTSPLPNMNAFDAPTREVCVVSRSRTSTPLQALVLLNDVQFVEASRKLAEQVAADHTELSDRIDEAFLRLTGRQPDAVEAQLLRKVFDEQHQFFADADEGDTLKYVRLGDSKSDSQLPLVDLAALTATCQVILNLDATIYER